MHGKRKIDQPEKFSTSFLNAFPTPKREKRTFVEPKIVCRVQ